MARIRRTGAGLSAPVPVAPITAARPWSDRAVLDWFAERFGLENQRLAGFNLWTKGEKTLWAAPSSCQPLPGLETIGLPFARLQTSETYKPTTTWLQCWGAQLTRHCIELEDPETLRAFLAGRDTALEADLDLEGCSQGFVCARYRGYQLGCGFYRPGLLRSQFPKHLGSLALSVAL